MMNNFEPLPASFRDPSGFVFHHNGVLYRQINQVYEKDYQHLMDSGLYERLVRAHLLIPHQPAQIPPASEQGIAVIQPSRIPFISYPYEWPFSLLKEAALVTLKIQKIALQLGMSLKDASAYNIQMYNGRPTFIDTLSFERYQEGQPWSAYRQFCQHFLAPLALMARRDIRLGLLTRVHLDGVPLDLASRLLPVRTRLNTKLLTHIHLHARFQNRYAGKPAAAQRGKRTSGKMSQTALTGLIENLRAVVHQLSWQPGGTEWDDYYDNTNYSSAAFQHKRDLVTAWLDRIRPSMVWDLGANDGTFSRIASQQGALTIAFDVDASAVERNYRAVRTAGETHLLPLLQDFTNPSPSIGWRNRERENLFRRGPADAVLALALIHHLAISNNVPLTGLAQFFRDTGRWVIIEFVPKSDSQVQRLLQSRKDIFPHYTEPDFEAAFEKYFALREKAPIQDSERTLYLLEKRG